MAFADEFAATFAAANVAANSEIENEYENETEIEIENDVFILIQRFNFCFIKAACESAETHCACTKKLKKRLDKLVAT